VTRWVVVGGGTAGCVVAANLAAGLPDDAVTLLEAGTELGGAALVNAGLVVGPVDGSRHRLPLEPPAAIGVLGRAVLGAHPLAAPARLARRRGTRVTAADVYLADAAPNLAVRCDTAVARIVFADRRAIGVITADGEHVAADRVVLCAGAVATPALLLRSGVTDIAGVGAGLQNHPGCAIALDLAVGAAALDLPEVPDVTVTVELGEQQLVVLERTPGAPGMGALLAGHLTPVGTGAVTVPDPDGPPLVTLDANAHPADAAGLRAAAESAFALAQQPGVAAVTAGAYVDEHGTTLAGLRAGGEPAVERWLRHAANPYHHFAGTCRAGVVTDDIGRVWLYRGLSVCDAALLPGVPRRNPYLAVIDLAERLSSAWVAGLRR